MGNCCKRRHVKKKIVLLLVGLDNAGKTKTVNGLAGNTCSSPVPTVGFSVIHLKYSQYDVNIFDLGGGSNIRGIWAKYFVNAHGIIFVIDSSDFSRFHEVKLVLEEILSNGKIAGKPFLILANKQDNETALDEVDIIEYLNIEPLVNHQKCPTLVQSCSASENNSKLDPGIKQGYEWLLRNVVRNYQTLNQRVESESKEQELKEREEMAEKIQRIREQQNIEKIRANQDIIETYSDYMQKISNNTKNGEQIVSVLGLENVELSSSSSKTSSSNSFPPVYVSNNCGAPERPKSAVQIVKHQLELSKAVRKHSLPLKSNKTAPINLFADKLPRSAQERCKHTHGLKLVDEAFTLKQLPSNGVSYMGPSGDYLPSKKNLQAIHNNKLPSINCQNKIVPWVEKPTTNGDVISVIEIE